MVDKLNKKAWGDTQKQAWLEEQSIQRSYHDEVIVKLNALPQSFERNQYGALSYDNTRYPLYFVKAPNWQSDKPIIIVTGGVHGYETSGVQGALSFLKDYAESYSEHFNILVAPCVSPWGYETINRWNPSAVDPNRSFYPESASEEARFAMQAINDACEGETILMHIDLHETTDTDNTVFRPALAARDGIEQKNWDIPDGFYLVANALQPQLAFQQAIIERVKQVTHIAPADADNKIIGESVVSDGVICYEGAKLYLCAAFTGCAYATTTEVYPDSDKTTPEECIAAQVAAVSAALDYLVENAVVN